MTHDESEPKPARGRSTGSIWPLPTTDRERALATRGTFLLHLRPIRVSRRAMRWTHTLGLGGSSLVLWLALASTGILMLLVYQPVPDVAYDSVRTLTGAVRFGPLVRGVHYWSANLLVVIVVAHVLRVVLTGGYHRPRRLNWVVGACLLAGVLGAAFTGYLLPWDQRAYWAVTIATGMLAYVPFVGEALQHVVRGGAEIGAETLLAFYTYHTTVLPVLFVGGMGFHFWRVRKAGGVIEPPPGDPGITDDDPDHVLFFPDLLIRELSQALVVLAIVVVLGALVGAPIGDRANPGMSPNPAKAPWYFMGFQELLIHLHPVFAVLIVPLVTFGAFVALPWLVDDDGPAGRWLLSPVGRRTALGAAGAGFALAAAAVLADGGGGSAAVGLLTRGVLPVAVLAALVGAGWVVLRRRMGANRNEAVQAVAVFLLVSFATLTAIGVFLRGEGMALTLPWGG